MSTPAPVQFTTADLSLAGPVSDANSQFSFVPLPEVLIYQERASQRGSLVFRNGLLVAEYQDYAAGNGWYLLTSELGV